MYTKRAPALRRAPRWSDSELGVRLWLLGRVGRRIEEADFVADQVVPLPRLVLLVCPLLVLESRHHRRPPAFGQVADAVLGELAPDLEVTERGRAVRSVLPLGLPIATRSVETEAPWGV